MIKTIQTSRYDPQFPTWDNSKPLELTNVCYFCCTVGCCQHPLRCNERPTTKVPGMIPHHGLNTHLPSIHTSYCISTMNNPSPSAMAERTSHHTTLLQVSWVSEVFLTRSCEIQSPQIQNKENGEFEECHHGSNYKSTRIRRWFFLAGPSQLLLSCALFNQKAMISSQVKISWNSSPCQRSFLLVFSLQGPSGWITSPVWSCSLVVITGYGDTFSET